MSEEEMIRIRNRWNDGLKASFENMLRTKRVLDQSVVVPDAEGNPIVVSAEEAWQLYQSTKNSDTAPRPS